MTERTRIQQAEQDVLVRMERAAEKLLAAHPDWSWQKATAETWVRNPQLWQEYEAIRDQAKVVGLAPIIYYNNRAK